jgi:hypothetical protein
MEARAEASAYLSAIRDGSMRHEDDDGMLVRSIVPSSSQVLHGACEPLHDYGERSIEPIQYRVGAIL